MANFARDNRDTEDARLAKRTGNVSAERQSRAYTDRPNTQNRETSDAIRLRERRARLRDVNTVLPQPPKIDGYHLCWLTTTNSRDPLEHRMRNDYTLVHPSEMPGFLDQNRQESSQKESQVVSDRIMVNEMVLAKIPEDIFQDDVKMLHYDDPLNNIKDLQESVTSRFDGRGREMAFTGGEFKNGVAEGYKIMSRMQGPNLNGIV